MKKIGIFYGTTTGTTQEVANLVAKTLNVSDEDVKNVKDAAPSEVGDYDTIILGASTWGDGDLQADMHDFLDGVAAFNLRGKRVALFGCGDETMSDTFCNVLAEMYRILRDTQATFVGQYNADGYHFNESKSIGADGRMIGLAIDNVNHPEITSERVSEWCKSLN